MLFANIIVKVTKIVGFGVFISFQVYGDSHPLRGVNQIISIKSSHDSWEERLMVSITVKPMRDVLSPIFASQ